MKDVNNNSEEETSGDNEETEVKSGKLTVSVEDYSSSVKSIPSSGTVIVNSIDFSSDEEVAVRGVSLEIAGLTAAKDIKSIRFEKNGKKIGNKSNISTDGTATINFNGDGMTVKKGESLDLVMELSDKASAGAEISFKITDVNSSAKNTKITSDLTTTLRTTTYTVAGVEFKAETVGSGTEYKIGDKDSYEIARFTITNNSDSSDEKTVVVKTVSLKNQGSADVKALSDLKVTSNSENVSKDVTVDGKTLIISLNDEIAAGKKKTYIVYANIDYVDAGDNSTETYQFSLVKDTDLVVDEVKSGFRAKPSNNGVDCAVFSVKGGKVKLSSTSSATSVDAGEGYSDVVIAEGSITSSTAVTIEEVSGTGSLKITGSGFENLKDIKLEIGNSTYTANITATGANSEAIVESDISIKSGTSKVVVKANMKSTIASGYIGSTIKFDNISKNSFSTKGNYSSNDETFNPNQIAGSIVISNINIKAAKFSITNTTTSNEVKVVATTSPEVVLFQGVMRNTQNSNINVNTITISGDVITGFQSNESLDIQIYVDGTYKDEITIKAGEAKKDFNSLGISLKAGEEKKIELRANPTTVTGGAEYEFYISAEGNDDNSNTVTASPIYVTKFIVTGQGSAKVSSDATISDSVFTKNTTDNVIAQWNVTVKDEDLTLKDIVISGTLSSAKLVRDWYVTYENGTIDNGDKEITTTGISMKDINVVLKPGTYTFTAKASVSYDNTATSGNKISTEQVDMNFEGVNPVVTTGTLKYNHIVLPLVPNISLVTAHKGDSVKIMTFRVTNTSKEDTMTISGFDLAVSPLSPAYIIKDANNNTVYTSASGYSEINIAAGKYMDFTVQAEDGSAFAKDTSVRATLKGIEFKADKDEGKVDSTMSNIAKWSDLDVSYTL